MIEKNKIKYYTINDVARFIGMKASVQFSLCMENNIERIKIDNNYHYDKKNFHKLMNCAGWKVELLNKNKVWIKEKYIVKYKE